MKITRTKLGLRLSQHGIVISELRTTPGPTHSVFDLLAALIAVFAPAGRVGVLGFAGGGMMAPLRQLGVEITLDAVDLDHLGYELFLRHCPEWSRHVNWQQADAVAWLMQQSPDFGLLLDDLSVPSKGDVVKPAISWNELPALIRRRLRPGGVGIFNLLPPSKGSWNSPLMQIAGKFQAARIIHMEEFDNRILIVGDSLPSARTLSARMNSALLRLQSKQSRRMQVRTLR